MLNAKQNHDNNLTYISNTMLYRSPSYVSILPGPTDVLNFDTLSGQYTKNHELPKYNSAGNIINYASKHTLTPNLAWDLLYRVYGFAPNRTIYI